MIIRCPHCEHTRSISESKIPSTAELATCPKCKHRFRFRTLRPSLDEKAAQSDAQSPPPDRQPSRSGAAAAPAAPVQEVIRPQQAFRESAEQRDIWDAVDELHQRWEAQLDQHVTDVSLEHLPDAEGADAQGPEQAGAVSEAGGAGGMADEIEYRAADAARPQPGRQAPHEAAHQAGQHAWQAGPPQAGAQTATPVAAPEHDFSGAAAAHAEPMAQRENSAGPHTAQESTLSGPDPLPGPRPSETLPGAQNPDEAAFGDQPQPPHSQTPPESAAPAKPQALPRSESLPEPEPESLSAPLSGSVAAGPEQPEPEIRAEAEDISASAQAGAAGAVSGQTAATAPPATPERPRFLYAEDGPDPEERVEQDLRMLHAADASRPTRDLGRLKEYPAGVENGETAESGEIDENDHGRLVLPASGNGPDAEDGVPWERGGNKLRSFWATVRGGMFGGPAFFAGISGSGSLAPGYLFFLLMGYFGALSSWAWFAAAKLLIPDLAAYGPAGTAVPALLLLGPAALGLILLFVTGWVRLSLRLLAPDKADFGKIYKVVSYSAGPLILCVVPFVGPLLGAAWSMAALAMGCRGALGLSRPLAVCVPVPPAALVLGLAAWCIF